MLINGIELGIYDIATERDVCYLCMREYSEDNKVGSLVEIKRALHDKLTGQKIVKFRHSGADVTICAEHIKKLAEGL